MAGDEAAESLEDAGATAARPPYLLFGVLGLLAALVAGAGALVLMGHPETPGAPVVVPLHSPAAPAPVPKAVPGAMTPPAASGGPPGQTAPDAGPPPSVKVPLGPPPPATPPKQQSSLPPAHALQPAPDPDLIERGTYGFVPVAGKGDDKPWKVYARPFDQTDQRPRIAVVIVGLGVSQSATDATIREAPPQMSLAFAPFARRLGQWMNLARANGHETLLELPMEPNDYPDQDPGFNALLTALSPAQNLDRLNWVMAQAAGYVGLVGRLGSRFSASGEAMKPILQDIAKRGLIYVDNRPTAQTVVSRLAPAANLSYADINRYVDMDPAPAAIDRSLSDLEELAKRKGFAVAAATSKRDTIAKLEQWAAGLEARGMVLAPISAVVPMAMSASTTSTASAKGDTP